MKRGGRISFFRRKNMVSQCRKNSWAPLQSFRKIVVSGNFTHKGVSRFSLENFLSHSAESFRGNPFNFSKRFGYRKFLCIIRVITFFRQKFSVPQCWKFWWAFLQCFRKIWVSKKLCILGVSQFSAGNCLSHSAESFCEGVLLFLRKFFDSENCLRIKRGAYHILLSKIFDLLVPKIFVSISAMCQKNCVNGKTYAY